MKRTINSSQLLGFAVASFAGTILHFLYDWLGQSLWIAPFSSVNESTFEHMKLLFWPTFLFAIGQSFFLRQKEFWCIKMRGILYGLLLIPVLFYTYNGAVAKSPDWLNIAIFFLSAALLYVWETRQFHSEAAPCRHPKIALSLLCILGILFAIFTFFPPQIGLFRDPVTGTYGI